MSDMLSSDILEKQFGPTKIEVLYQDTQTRAIRTLTVSGGQVLELSHVKFLDPGITKFPDIHQEVVEGKSMGKAFRDHRVRFERVTRIPAGITCPRILTFSLAAAGLLLS